MWVDVNSDHDQVKAKQGMLMRNSQSVYKHAIADESLS